MNQKTGTFWGRIGILLTVVLLLASVLSGCATGKSGVTKPTIGDIVMDGSYEGKLTAAQLKAVATPAVEHLCKGFSDHLSAARRIARL